MADLLLNLLTPPPLSQKTLSIYTISTILSKSLTLKNKNLATETKKNQTRQFLENPIDDKHLYNDDKGRLYIQFYK